ncbi:MAG: hypothetical protein QNK05_17910 [Myxococcota bacterium]|nr:hypothetical protein [Myxococcota bacterium]
MTPLTTLPLTSWIRRHFENGWTADAYAWLRGLLGAYLVVHFAALIPWAGEVFSSAGVVPDPSHSPLIDLFPNVLGVLDGPVQLMVVLGVGALAAGALAVGLGDKLAALVCWYLLACLFGRNPLIANPSLPYVGWLLLFHVFFGPPRRAVSAAGWRLSPTLFALIWAVMAAGYTYSGLTKLSSPSWLDGTAIAHVLANPLARDTALRVALLELPAPLLHLLSWSTLMLELLFLPLALLKGLRPWLWLAMVGLHLGLVATLDFADLTVGMLVLHAFAFDPRWGRNALRWLEEGLRELGRFPSLGFRPLGF